MIKIGILASYNGSGFVSINEACNNKELRASVEVVISNNSDANVLKIATNKNIKNFCVNSKKYPDENIDLKILNTFKEYGCDYIFLSGYMKKIDKTLTDSYHNRIINCHPALLPDFGGKGMYGKYVHEAVIKAGVKKSGATVHFINENYDEGEFILQEEILLDENETALSLEEKIKNLEKIVIIKALKKVISDI
jgi:phosphoribosylglycinamide formyltransferase-1